jgi:hypothetical protein
MEAAATSTIVRVGHPQVCSRCGATVAWARTNAGKNILMDFRPAPLGEFVVVGQVDSHCVVAKCRVVAEAEPRFMCHWDTCANARPRRPKRSYRRRLSPEDAKFKRDWDRRARASA